jgi:hypothetical protein
MLRPDAIRAKSLQLHLELSPFSLWHRHEQGKPREASVRQRTAIGAEIADLEALIEERPVSVED